MKYRRAERKTGCRQKPGAERSAKVSKRRRGRDAVLNNLVRVGQPHF